MGSHGKTEPVQVDENVVSESSSNPGVRTVQIHRPEPEEASFLPAAVKGIGITLGHFRKNVFGRKKNKQIETVQYPEEKVEYPERFRGLHRLMLRDDDTARCVACMCCPTVCPANCITIVPAERDDAGVEKYPARFEIDELRCVVCGLCVEACPCDAIRMDTGVHAPPATHRSQAIMTKESLMERGEISTAVQGGKGPDWRD